MVYVSYSFLKNLTQGDKFEIFVGDDKAAEFSLIGEFALGEITTRVRVETPSVITGKITWHLNSKPPEILEYNVEEVGGLNMPNKCDTTAEHKLKRHGDEYKVLFSNHMSDKCFIDFIEFEGDKGKLVVELSNKMARNPYFHLVGVKGVSDLKVNSRVHIE
jgi:hypothetical protein